MKYNTLIIIFFINNLFFLANISFLLTFEAMNWDNIIGQDALKKQLQESVKNNRIGQALIFLGQEGYGILPLILAFCREIISMENPESAIKIDSLNHIDMHFSFPTYITDKKNTSSSFINIFREQVLSNPYFDFEDWTNTLEDWTNTLKSKNKQLTISTDEIENIIPKLRLKSYEGGHKILIIWNADRMKDVVANKFLKTLEEPPEKTLIILTANSLDNFLPTITSRTQIIKVKNIDDEAIKNQLEKQNIDENTIQNIIFQAQGNWNKVLKILSSQNIENKFEEHFIKWVRYAFNAKTKPQYLKEILLWADDTSSWNRETQKHFLNYASEIFRLALLENYTAQSLVYKKLKINNFKWDSFSKFINGINIQNILEEISEANNHITRNGNAKIIWTDLGIKLTRFLHKKT